MLRLVTYFDASGHPDGDHALSVGGFVSSVPKWERFEKRWVKRLKAAGITMPLHMTDFMARRGDFKNWRGREDEQNRLLVQLTGIILEDLRWSCSTMVLLPAWRKANEVYALDKHHCSPFGLCGFFTMHKVFAWLLKRTRNHESRYIFEHGDKNRGDLIWMMDQFIQKNPRLAGARPTFEKQKTPALQAADMLLWEQRRVAQHRLTKPKEPLVTRESFRRLVKSKKNWGLIDEEKLLAFCEDFEVPKRDQPSTHWSPFREHRRDER